MATKRLDTKLIHSGEPHPRIHGAANVPIFQNTVFELHGEAHYDDIRYIRLSNLPNHLAVGAKVAALENAEAGLVAASGMAAISAALLSMTGTGDRVLAQAGLYGGTHSLLARRLGRLGIACDWIDANDPDSWERLLHPSTRAVYVEAISNPLLRVADLEAVADFARRHGLVSIVDATLATPINLRAAEWGIDLIVHSASKYLNGHSDVVAGVVVGRSDLVEEVTQALNLLGGALDPHACFLLHRGLKTLGLRVRRQNDSALLLAESLAAHPKVARVHYPGRADHPDNERACELLDGFGGMLGFELAGGSPRQTDALLRTLSIPLCAPSLGGVETLVTRPVTTSHSELSDEELARFGIAEYLVRVSVGLEAPEDLIDDFTRALNEDLEAIASEYDARRGFDEEDEDPFA